MCLFYKYNECCSSFLKIIEYIKWNKLFLIDEEDHNKFLHLALNQGLLHLSEYISLNVVLLCGPIMLCKNNCIVNVFLLNYIETQLQY